MESRQVVAVRQVVRRDHLVLLDGETRDLFALGDSANAENRDEEAAKARCDCPRSRQVGAPSAEDAMQDAPTAVTSESQAIRPIQTFEPPTFGSAARPPPTAYTKSAGAHTILHASLLSADFLFARE